MGSLPARPLFSSISSSGQKSPHPRVVEHLRIPHVVWLAPAYGL